MNTLYPIFLKLTGSPVLVVGGGNVAGQKIKSLLASNASVTVVAPDVTRMISDLAKAGAIQLHKRPYRSEDVTGNLGYSLIFGATDEPAVQDQVFRDAKRRGIPVNIADVPDRCMFYLSSVFEKGDLKVAVSTNGKSPTLGKTIRDRIGELVESGYPELLEFLGGIRQEVHSRHAQYEERKRDFELIVQNSLKKLDDKESLLLPQKLKTNHQRKVYLVGAGPGDPELITVKGLRLLQRADVVVYDALINLDLLDHLPLTAERILAGKRGGNHSTSQEEINRILIDRANHGNVVVRLKGGDPFVFGRGGEELKVLRETGIEVEVVPGITSGTGVPASIGLPLTYRRVSSSVVFVTGHECGDKERPVDWNSIAGIDTIVVYMGIRNIGTIATSLRNAGKSPDTPAAVVFSGTWAEETIIEGTLGSIVERISERESGRPGLIFIGEVVRLLHRQGDRRTVKETHAVEDLW